MRYIKTPVVFVYRCELVDTEDNCIALIEGDYETVAQRGAEIADVINSHDNLVIACERAKTYFDRVLIQTGEGEVMELVECLSDALAATKES